MPKKSNTGEFIEKAYKIHGNKYDYSKTVYNGRDVPVVITCPIHGDFLQTPHDHLSGCKCQKCAKEERFNKLRKDKNTWIKQAKEIHGDKYDYSKVNYINANTPVTITCPIHGDFSMSPSNHVRQHQGCPKCGNLKKGSYKKSNTEQFVNKSHQVHGDKYDYSKVNYINNHTKVCIICPKHGEFWQKPIDHLNGHGCPECAKKFGISEKFVLEKLKEIFPDTEYQKKLPFLKSKTSFQTIDFFIPSLNIGIEYQGRQHFGPTIRFGDDERYKITYERDFRKYQKCKENGIKLFYISFEKFLPENYFDKIYNNIEDLINAIKNDVPIKLTENDICKMITEIITKYLY